MHIHSYAAGQGTVLRIGNCDLLVPLLPQDYSGKGVDALVRCGELVIGRKRGRLVRTAEVDRAGVASHDIAVGVIHRKRQAEGDARLDTGRGLDVEPAGRGRRDPDAAVCIDKIDVRGIDSGDPLHTGRLQCHHEKLTSRICRGKGVIGRQCGLVIAAGEMHSAGVAGDGVAIGIFDRDRDILAVQRLRSKESRSRVAYWPPPD